MLSKLFTAAVLLIVVTASTISHAGGAYPSTGAPVPQRGVLTPEQQQSLAAMATQVMGGPPKGESYCGVKMTRSPDEAPAAGCFRVIEPTSGFARWACPHNPACPTAK
jgi:hypothetical protein